MRIYHTFPELRSHGQPLCVAIGVFDGLHIGHQEVVRQAIEAARSQSCEAALVTFDPHPIRIIAPNKAPVALLTPIDHKAELAAGLGLDVFAPLVFDQAMAEMQALDFVEELAACGVRFISVGEDWRFGHHRAGDIHLLASEGARLGFQVKPVPPVMWEGDRISSTRIRQALHDGNLTDVESMLGRPWSFLGVVRHGEKVGRTLGFPTANLHPDGVQLPPHGVWVVTARHGSNEWPAVANLGVRPTLGSSQIRLEVHLLEGSPDLYGQALEVRFHHRLRPEERFESLDQLRSAIAADTAAARSWHDQQRA